ncbi:protein anachronism [Teleopsis dalmanni]|uniref:protein anachronism n=1 Tax=Teleopsis dalmanni TaxID=139649 RepID=UPI0018CE2FED|nr:protein anachronism [Teleopsis dalmanni]
MTTHKIAGFIEFNQLIMKERVNDIRNRLQSALLEKTWDESQEHPLHEIAYYPVCSSEFDESSWAHDNNITIRFSDTLFEPNTDRINLDSAVLRLYKINPNFTSNYPNVEVAEVESRKNKRCAEPVLDTQIRITVSIVQQLRRNKPERKKRICNTVMMNSSSIGWVEIDIKRAIYIWETVQKQQNLQQMSQTRQPVLIGWLMIEVHDEEERPLKPGLYFNPPKCEEAGLAIPWNFYRFQPSMSSYTTNEVPRYPRLDVKLIGYAAFAPKNYNKLQQQELSDNLRRQLNSHPKSSIATDIEATTNLAPTADNSLESSVSTELLHNHRKRHSRHYHHEIPAEQHTHANHHRKRRNDHSHHPQHDRYLHALKLRQEPQQKLEKVDC